MADERGRRAPRHGALRVVMAAPVAADADEPSYDPLQDVLGDIEPSDEHYKLFPKPISGCRNLDELARHVRSPEYKQLRDKPELHIPGLTDVNEPALADTVATTARVQVKFASKLSRALVRYAGAVMFSCVFLTVGPILVGGKSGPLHESVKTAWLSVAERLDTEAGQAELLCPTGSPHRIDEVLVEVKQLATKLGGPDATLGSIPAIFRAAGQPDSSAKAVSLACATVCALMVLIWASHDVFVLGLEPLGERSVYKDVRLLHGHAACLMGGAPDDPAFTCKMHPCCRACRTSAPTTLTSPQRATSSCGGSGSGAGFALSDSMVARTV